MATYTLISSNVLASSAASVTFSAIPATYTDLVLRISARTSANPGGYSYLQVTYNGTASGYSDTLLYKDGTNATPLSQRASGSNSFWSSAGTGLPFSTAANTSNAFGSAEIYIPSYTASQYKPASAFSVQEDNSTAQYMVVDASLSTNTSAITSVTITAGDPNFVATSSFYLYGISNT
jgi:hypothetical protein